MIDSIQIPGVMQSLEKVINVNQDIYKKLTSASHLNVLTLKDLKKINHTNISLHPEFIRNILFNSSEQYLSLIEGEQSECLLYSLIENRLVRTSSGIIQRVILLIKKNKKNIIATSSASDFLKFVYEKQCYTFKQISSVFLTKNYLHTLDRTQKPLPQTNKDCNIIMTDWKKNLHLPYLCKIVETISIGNQISNLLKQKNKLLGTLTKLQKKILSEANIYRRGVSTFEKSYFKNICHNINRPENFCSTYLIHNIWDEVIRGEKPISLMKLRCKEILKKVKLNRSDLTLCKIKMEENPQICTTLNIFKYPSIFPRPNCHQIAKAYSVSRLNINRQDCPAKIEYENIINISRIIGHLIPKKGMNTPQTCEFEAYQQFADTVINDKDDDISWPLKICYKDLASSREECLTYIPGHHPTNHLSEEQRVALALSKIKGASPKELCKIISKKEFNPVLLEYKSGCFIVTNRKRCGGLGCIPKIYYRGKIIDDLYYKTNLDFVYFPLNYLKEKLSMSNIIKKNYKIRMSKIHNITILKNYLNEYPSGIIHGVGCIQNLMPRFFKIQSLNDCIPTPFIIDGFTKNKGNILLSTRTAIDNLHAPRLVDWNLIFNAVSNFKELHPLNTWTLYGIRK